MQPQGSSSRAVLLRGGQEDLGMGGGGPVLSLPVLAFPRVPLMLFEVGDWWLRGDRIVCVCMIRLIFNHYICGA